MPDIVNKSEAQKGAEADVEGYRQDLGPFVIAADTTRMAMLFTNAREENNPIIFANDSALKLTGYDRDEILGRCFEFLLADESDVEAIDQLRQAFADDLDDNPEFKCRRKDGSEFWATLLVSPVKDDSGKIVQHFASLVDVTGHKVAQTNAEMLIDELNHRVKNTLATVLAIVAQAVRDRSDPTAIRDSIESRIGALSRSHDVLSREKWTGAGLHDLVEAAMEPFGASGVGSEGRVERFTIEGDNIRLSPKATLALGIAFHELATNAVKYGAFSNTTGSISISWTITTDTDGRWLCLYWRETGGPAVTPPARRGFGSRVLEQGLANELGGKVRIDYQPEGIVCMIHVPAPQAVLDE